MRGQLFEDGFALSRAPPGADHVEAEPPRRDQVGDHLRRVLQIGIDDDHRLPPRVVQTGGGGDFLAEVARQADQGDALIIQPQELDRLPRQIVAAVIDVNRLPTAQGLHRGDQAVMKPGDALGLIHRRHDDGKRRAKFGLKMRSQSIGHGKVR